MRWTIDESSGRIVLSIRRRNPVFDDQWSSAARQDFNMSRTGCRRAPCRGHQARNGSGGNGYPAGVTLRWPE